MARILVVDDDPFIRSAHLRNLQRAGYEVLEVDEGRQAITLLLDAARTAPVDLVLLDYMLPGMDGLTTFTAMAEALGDDCPPVIMVTGQGSTHLAVEFMKAGGADFMQKPISDYVILDIRMQRAIASARAQKGQRAEIVAREAAQASDRLKDEFIGFVARELQSPLRGVMESARRLSEQARSGECANADDAELLATGIADVARVVDDLLELAQLDRLAPIVLMPTDIPAVLAGIEPAVRKATDAKRLDLVWDVPAALPKVMSNPDKLAEIIGKLLDNAVKFTDTGRVELHAESDGQDVLVVVRDSGRGIAPEDQKRVFGRFAKLTQTAPTPGAGIGLFIAKRLCDRMNATLRLESTPGKGTAFFLGLSASG